jgi:hypothetical protein
MKNKLHVPLVVKSNTFLFSCVANIDVLLLQKHLVVIGQAAAANCFAGLHSRLWSQGSAAPLHYTM